jgi:hypothetical protein
MRIQKIKAITEPLVLKRYTHNFQLRQSVADTRFYYERQ